MEKYRIRVNNEAESKEAHELFIQLGYELDLFFGKYEANTKWVLAFADGSMGCASEALVEDTLKEITLPQLRDLVVLKLGDGITDNTVAIQNAINPSINKPKDPALISGAEALRALADGKDVEGFSEENEEWIPIVYFTVQEVVNGLYKFRLKPQTIKLELEFPKPFEPKVGEIYWYLTTSNSKGYDWNQFQSVMGDEFYCQFGAYRTEDEIKQVVEQLRKIKGAV